MCTQPAEWSRQSPIHIACNTTHQAARTNAPVPTNENKNKFHTATRGSFQEAAAKAAA